MVIGVFVPRLYRFHRISKSFLLSSFPSKTSYYFFMGVFRIWLIVRMAGSTGQELNSVFRLYLGLVSQSRRICTSAFRVSGLSFLKPFVIVDFFFFSALCFYLAEGSNFQIIGIEVKMVWHTDIH